MLEPMILKTSPSVRIRLQAPALLIGDNGVYAEIADSRDGWNIRSGSGHAKIRVSQIAEDYFLINGTITNKGKDTWEARYTFPPMSYHFAKEATARIFHPKYGGI